MNKKILMSLCILGKIIFSAEAYYIEKETPDLWMLAYEASRCNSAVKSDSKYKCNYCNKKYKTYNELVQHMYLKHALERPFACEICHVNFELKSYLRIHQGMQYHYKNAEAHKSGLPDLIYLNK